MRVSKVFFAIVAGLALLLTSVRADAAQILYGADGSGGSLSTLYTINTTTGAATPIGAIGFSITGLAFDPTTGILYGATSRLEPSGFLGLVTINPLTGAGTAVGLYGTGSETMADISFDSNGNLFGFLEPSSDDLYSINKSTGAATLVGNSPGSAITGLAFDNSDVLYHESAGTLNILSATTGLLVTTVGSAGILVGMGMDFDASNTLFAIEKLGSGSTGARNLVTVNTSTGAATLIGSTQAGLDALAFSSGVVIPEPSSLALLSIGTLGLLVRRRRKRQRLAA